MELLWVWQLIVSVGLLKAELGQIVSLLFSFVQACRTTTREKGRKNGCEGELPLKRLFCNISFLFADTSPIGCLPHPLAQAPSRATCPQTKNTLKQRSFSSSSYCENIWWEKTDHIETDVCLFGLDIWRQTLFSVVAVAAHQHAIHQWLFALQTAKHSC